ncbi:hypothetical protein DPMN_070547 [Dreissena polymorpha]|uniref:Secreted protein n=1 Tax=Dreissena polymorpha TaxID=45954 RepID=A0A9D4BX79_DREPO|nr:hypothetical protein DPMN_070547 [Dreissena polymorpha]
MRSHVSLILISRLNVAAADDDDEDNDEEEEEKEEETTTTRGRRERRMEWWYNYGEDVIRYNCVLFENLVIKRVSLLMRSGNQFAKMCILCSM